MNKINSTCYTDKLHHVEVEFNSINALPGFSIVGLASTKIKESIERVKSALLSINVKLPPKKLIINLSPSDLSKDGTHFDLAIALLSYFKDECDFEDFYVFGELGLDASVKASNTLFSMLLFLSVEKKGAKVLIPKQIAQKVSLIHNLEVYAVENLSEAISFFENKQNQTSFKVQKTSLNHHQIQKIAGKDYVINTEFKNDFIHIKGQENAKLASKIAAFGMHNILFEGSPGCGKSMCAKAMVYIMPPQSIDEMLESNAYKSLNNDEISFDSVRSFRAPHSSSSTPPSILGGGSGASAKIGEIALAHHGVLFFDEFTMFSKKIIESLREPLENNYISISRVNSKTTYQTKFLFIAAQNPCPCGNLFSKEQNCRCTPQQISRYKSTISSPIYDRIDLYVAMDESEFDAKSSVSSKQLYGEVLKAFIFQKEIRKQDEFNGKLDDIGIKTFIIPHLSTDANDVLNLASKKYNLSLRATNKVLKVARSLADFDESLKINKTHILTALNYRIKF